MLFQVRLSADAYRHFFTKMASGHIAAKNVANYKLQIDVYWLQKNSQKKHLDKQSKNTYIDYALIYNIIGWIKEIK